MIENEIPTVSLNHKSPALYIFQIFRIDLSSATIKKLKVYMKTKDLEYYHNVRFLKEIATVSEAKALTSLPSYT